MATGMAQAKIDAALDAEIVPATTYYLQLHVGDPGPAGTANVSSQTTREAVTFAAAASGQKASDLDAAWPAAPAAETYSDFSLWTAATGGTFVYSGTISGGAVTVGAIFKLLSGSVVLSGSGAA